MRPVGFGDNEQTRGLLVEAVDDSGPFRLAFSRQAAPATQQCIDQSARPVSRGGMDDHSGRFVDHQQRVVLVDHMNWDVFARNCPFLDGRYFYAHRLTDFRPVARFFAPAAHQDVSECDQSSSLGAREICLLGDKEIEADIAVRLDGKLSYLGQG